MPTLGAITITSIKPQATYEPTFSNAADEMRQLVDGNTTRRKLWTSNNSVGWAFKSPVQIDMSVDTANAPAMAKFRIRAENTGIIKAPGRIDIYGMSAGRRLYLGSWNASSRPGKPQGEPIWITTPTVEIHAHMTLVVHARHRVMAIDEITLRAGEKAPPGELVTKMTIGADSGERYRAHLLEEHYRREVVAMSKFGTVSMLTDPFGDLSLPVNNQPGKNNYRSLATNGSAWLGLLLTNASKFNEHVQVGIAPPAVGKASFFEARPIAAFPGTVVFDPLNAMPGGTFEVAAESALRALIKIDTTALAVGTTELDIIVVRGGQEERLSATISRPLAAGSKVMLRRVVWAYESSHPTWRNRREAMSDIAAHAINVNVVHPSLIPGEIGASWSNIDAERLRRKLNKYPEGTVHLFYLAWDKHVGFNNSTASERKWLTEFTAWIERAEKNGTWGIYPIDEPHRRKADLLIEVATDIKAINRKTLVYANPISGIELSQLEKLRKLIDYWQPDYRALTRHESFFDSVAPENRWFFQNPKYGAKSTAPLFYRLHGWIAARYKLSGIGTWSYDDTMNSSAWNDFDGLRPDWSLVYESADGVISSRRWEAFTRGGDEYSVAVAAAAQCPEIRDRIDKISYSTTASEVDEILADAIAQNCLTERELSR